MPRRSAWVIRRHQRMSCQCPLLNGYRCPNAASFFLAASSTLAPEPTIERLRGSATRRLLINLNATGAGHSRLVTTSAKPLPRSAGHRNMTCARCFFRVNADPIQSIAIAEIGRHRPAADCTIFARHRQPPDRSENSVSHVAPWMFNEVTQTSRVQHLSLAAATA